MHDINQHVGECAASLLQASVGYLETLKNIDAIYKIWIQIEASKHFFEASLKAFVDNSTSDDMPDIKKYDMVDNVMKLYDSTELRHKLIQIAFGGKK